MRVWSTHRPISLGTYPREYGVKDIHNFNRREWVEEIHNYAWGYIDFEQDLPEDEQRHYDLWPEVKTDQKLDKVAKLFAKALVSGNMGRISKIVEKAYQKAIIEDEEQLVKAAQKYM